MFHHKMVGRQIHHFEFYSQYKMASTFLRFQEFYESPSPVFRGRVIDLELYMDWYAEHTSGTKNFTYYSDWEGFNIPGKIFKIWVQLYHPSIRTQKEATLVRALTSPTTFKNDFYIVANLEGDKETLRHELAHAFFYLYPDYRDEQIKLVSALPQYVWDRYKEVMLAPGMGYSDNIDILLDEFQAYIGMETLKELRKVNLVDKDKPFDPVLVEYREKMQRIYRKKLREIA